jgi:putative membrane protein
VLTALVVTQFIDSRFIKNKEYSKSLHMSLFGNLIWLIMALLGLASVSIFSKTEPSLLVIAVGMFLFASFRIGLLTTVLGLKIGKAWLVCFLQPITMYLALIPQDLWYSTLLDPLTLGFGTAFLVLATTWSIFTDKAGRPEVNSTHELVQAYLSSIGKNDLSEMESLIEKRSKSKIVNTSQIRLKTKDKNSEFRLVLPEIHPGPYHPIGGSNIPYLIYKNLDSSAMVMHSISDHSLNLPSKNEVDNYLKSLSSDSISQEGLTCTEPVTVQINKARVIGILFGKNALLFLSLSPYGMEDLPSYVKTEIEQYSKNRMFERVMVVDCHNAMGKEISQTNSEDMLTAAKSCLDTLISKENFPLEFGYANSSDMNLNAHDLGMGGISVLCLKINSKKYFLGWADANNMENGVREKIVEHFTKNNYNLLEICTSDTHYSSVKVRNKNGYYQLGFVTSPQILASWYLDIAKKSENTIGPAKFEIIENHTNVKVMGPKIFEDYSNALDRSLRLTKGFAIGGFALFLASLIL